jgi:hypothetical protein
MALVLLTFVEGMSGQGFSSTNVISKPEQGNDQVSQMKPALNVSGSNESKQFWYVGASVRGPLNASNQGLRSIIQVRGQSIEKGVLSFWISEALGNDLWAQVGYYIQNGSGPIAFFQVWNLTNRFELTSNTTGISDGNHVFEIRVLPKTTIWNFSIDGKSFGSYDMQTKSSNATYPIYAMSEEGYASHPFSFEVVLFPTAIQILDAGSWQNVTQASSFGNSWGIQGHTQNIALTTNEIAVGGSYPVLKASSDLWTE